MDGDEIWRWIWLAVAVGGVVGEMATAGLFFLLPFGIGAAVACLLAFAGAGLVLQWLSFVVVSALAVAFTRPIAARLERSSPTTGAGARRLIGRTGTVVGALPGGDGAGVVRVEGEEWRAVTQHGVKIPVGSQVLVTEVTGTRLEVLPLELAEGDG